MSEELFLHGFPNFISVVIGTILVCSFLSWLTLKGVVRNKYSKRPANSHFMRNTMLSVIWTVGLLIILSQIVPLQPLGETLLTTGGILAVSFSIAAQTALGNYIAGFFIVIHQPFEPGDAVYVKEMRMAGIVREINFRHTTLETANGNMIRVPNTVMNSVTIEDLTDNGYTRDIEFKVANGSDFDRMKKIINEIVSAEELSAKNDPLITIDSFDSLGCTVSVSLTARTMTDFYNLRSSVIQKLSAALPENGITIV